MNFLKWLIPGMNVKRWLMLLFFGVVGFALGLGLVMAFVLRSVRLHGTTSRIVATATLQFIPRADRGVLLIGLGLAIVMISLLKLSTSLLSVFLPNPGSNVADLIYRRRKLPRGPRIVAIGGGTGLSILLRGLKEYTSNLTAVVTVADDGGKERLRRDLGVLPPTDFRNCIVALSDQEPLMGRLFQYRFAEGSGLDGHSFGNLFIVALAHITGSFEKALREVGRVLAVRGQILPSTLADVRLSLGLDADGFADGGVRQLFKRVRLDPEDAIAYPEATRAILEADMVVLAPGSLYSSVLPSLLVPGIREAIRSSRALKVFVCNVATRVGETDGFDVVQHIALLKEHVGEGTFDYVIANDNLSADLPSDWPTTLVPCQGLPAEAIEDLRVVEMDVVDDANPLHHDPSKLGEGLLKLYYDQASRRVSAQFRKVSPVAAVKTA